MSDFIQFCRDLLSTLEQAYTTNSNTTQVDIVPYVILWDYEMCLWAQSRQGIVTVNMRSPQLKRELERLAERGAGHVIVWDDVKFQFVRGNQHLVL